FFKGVPSRIGYLLDMAPKELEKVLYFAASIVTWVDDEARQKDLGKLEKEIDKTIQSYEAEREERVMELREAVDRRVKYLETGDQKGFSDDDLLWADTLDVNLKRLSDDERGKMEKDLRKQFDADIADTEAYYEDGIERLRQTWELFQTMEPKQVIADETLFRELKDRFGSPFGWGEYFRGGMGAESVRDLLQLVDLDAEREELEDQVKTAKGQKQSRAVKRLKVVSAFIHSDNRPEDMVLEAVPVIPPELRPMVQLDGGRFATSDLNDLYRRVINRNNRLKRLLDLGAPEIIVNNEKRMLQESVDALFDNGRRGRPVTGPGIQAFEPQLVEGKAIQIPPLVCTAFNADFDGDQMAVHLPLSAEAQAEARILMLSTNNILKPSDGRPVTMPTLDMVIGLFFLTTDRDGEPGEGRAFSSVAEAIMAFDMGEISLQSKVRIRFDDIIPPLELELGEDWDDGQ